MDEERRKLKVKLNIAEGHVKDAEGRAKDYELSWRTAARTLKSTGDALIMAKDHTTALELSTAMLDDHREEVEREWRASYEHNVLLREEILRLGGLVPRPPSPYDAPLGHLPAKHADVLKRWAAAHAQRALDSDNTLVKQSQRAQETTTSLKRKRTDP